MTGPPDRRSPRPGEDAGASGNDFTGNQQFPQNTRPRHRWSRRQPGLRPIGPVLGRIVQRLGQHRRLVEGGRP